RPVGPIDTLEIPETLQALIAARLDGLAPQERRLLQDGAVLGKTFARHALAALSGLGEPQLKPLLAGLVRKEVLSIQADPRSPEHGQYGFLQDLVRRVAYETLSKRERKARHLAAAAYLEQALGLFEGAGERHQAARVTARLGEVEWMRGQLDAALERMERAWGELEGEEPDADIAALAAQIGRLHLMKGEVEAGSERLET